MGNLEDKQDDLKEFYSLFLLDDQYRYTYIQNRISLYNCDLDINDLINEGYLVLFFSRGQDSWYKLNGDMKPT